MILFAIARLHWGVDFADEALYIAMPYRFALGDRPFVDDWYLQQTTGMLVYPFIKAFVSFWGTNGIILYGRWLFFLLSVGIAVTTFRLFIKKADRSTAVLGALAVLIFAPYGIPNLGYNAVGASFLLLGLVVMQTSVSRIFPGLFHGIAAFAYPTLGLSLVYMLFFTWKMENRRSGFWYAVGVLLVPLLLFILYQVRISDFVHTMQFMFQFGEQTNHNWGFQKAWLLLLQLWNAWQYKALFLGWAIGIIFSVRYQVKAVTGVLTLAWPILLFFSCREVHGGMGMSGFLLVNALVGIFIYILLNDKSYGRTFWGVAMPSLIAGGVYAWTSNNEINAAGMGTLPANLMTLLLFAQLVARWDLRLRPVPALLFLVFLVYYSTSVNQDDPVRELTKRVEFGPFRGLYTTPEKASYIEELQRDVASLSGKGIRFVPHLPAGYLLTTILPATPTLWDFCPNKEVCEEFYRERTKNGDGILVQIKRLHYMRSRIENWETTNPGETLIDRKNYRIARTRYSSTIP